MSAPILVVDDDVAFTSALAGSLRRRGETVLVAHDRSEGLREALAFRPGRVLVDLRMPGGGLELIRDLRRDLPSAKLVVLTGFGSIATAVEAVKAGAVEYLTKPVSAERILLAFEDSTHSGRTSEPPASVHSLERLEWEHLQRVLTEAGGNVSEAARRLGMHRRSLQRKLQRGPAGLS